MGDQLTPRQLNRATMARQLLLERAAMPALDAVGHLVGLQAQVPSNPFIALWSRLDGFAPDELEQLLLDRKVVRIVVMRATIHLVTAEDCLVLRPLTQPVLDAEIARHRDFAPHVRDLDLTPVLAFARKQLAANPLTGPQLRTALHERFPEHDATALAYACRNFLALVQVPPRGLWTRSAQVTTTIAEAWLGRPLAKKPSIDAVVLRYLAAFGPATPADVSAWSRLTAMREVLDRLRPQLRVFTDARGREVFDLPDAPRPDADTPGPPRFLPEYDNVLLSHADRSRFGPPVVIEGPISGTVLYDGFLTGTWYVERGTDAATLVVRHLGPLTKKATAAIGKEGERLLHLLEPGRAARDVRFSET